MGFLKSEELLECFGSRVVTAHVIPLSLCPCFLLISILATFKNAKMPININIIDFLLKVKSS